MTDTPSRTKWAEGGRTVLLIEDNPAHAELLMLGLESHTPMLDLVTVSSGASAMGLLEEVERGDRVQPDVVLLDLSLPAVSGHEVLGRIRGSDILRELPVVITTCSQDPEDLTRVAELGVSGYLVKPVQTAQLRLILDRLLMN